MLHSPDYTEMWIGYENGAAVFALGSQTEVDRAIRGGLIDSAATVNQYHDAQRDQMAARWRELPPVPAWY